MLVVVGEASQKIPDEIEPELVKMEILIEPVPVLAPMVFPDVVPMFALPAPR